DQIAVEIDLDEIGGRHLVEQQPEAVEQEMPRRARNPRRNVGVDQIGPTEMLDEPVTRREIDALLPFSGIDVALCGSADGGSARRHARLLKSTAFSNQPLQALLAGLASSFQPLWRLSHHAPGGVVSLLARVPA